MEDTRQTWGRNLATARKARGFATQEAFASALGVRQQSVSAWEAGKTAPTDATRRKIATLLQIPVYALFTEPVAS